MAQDYTINAVSPKSEDWSFQGDKGKVNMTSFYVKTAETGDKVLKLNRSSKKGAPNTGDVVHGYVKPDKKGVEMLKEKKKEQRESFGGKKKYGRSPEETESIQKQTALKAAVEYANVSLDAGTHQTPEQVTDNAQIFFNWLKGEAVDNPFKNDVNDDKPVDLSDIPL